MYIQIGCAVLFVEENPQVKKLAFGDILHTDILKNQIPYQIMIAHAKIVVVVSVPNTLRKRMNNQLV